MKTIPFPPQYKPALLKKTKNTTLRIKDELNKYKTNTIYQANSYAGKN